MRSAGAKMVLSAQITNDETCKFLLSRGHSFIWQAFPQGQQRRKVIINQDCPDPAAATCRLCYCDSITGG